MSDKTDLEKLRAFAQELFIWNDPGDDVNGADLQSLAEKCGLIIKVYSTERCGDHCACEDFPVDCFRKTAVLTGKEHE